MSYNQCDYAKSVKRIQLLLFMVIMSCFMYGCGGRPNANGSSKAEDGRSYGGIVEGELGDKISTVFFDVTVNSARKCTTYQFQDGLYIADAGTTYLEVELTITNTYDKDLPMSISDFTLDFSENESDEPITGFGNTEIGKEEYMDNIYTLKQGESITKKILYIVADRAEYLLCYKEYYEDKFEGDSYEITMVPEELEPAVTTEASNEEMNDESATETPADAEAGINDNEEAVDGNGDGTVDNSSESQGDNNSEEDIQSDGDDTGIIEQ